MVRACASASYRRRRGAAVSMFIDESSARERHAAAAVALSTACASQHNQTLKFGSRTSTGFLWLYGAERRP